MLLLTTTGRNSGAKRTTPLIYQRHGDDYLVVASNGGGDPPGWFLNLQVDPVVAVQVKADHHTARARVATAEEKPELWRIMTATGTPYDDVPGQGRPRDPGGGPRAGLGPERPANPYHANALGARLDGPGLKTVALVGQCAAQALPQRVRVGHGVRPEEGDAGAAALPARRRRARREAGTRVRRRQPADVDGPRQGRPSGAQGPQGPQALTDAPAAPALGPPAIG